MTPATTMMVCSCTKFRSSQMRNPNTALYPQICFLMMVNVIGQRMNFLMIIHGCWLVVILSKRRRAAIARVWPSYCVFLSVFMIYQYLLCLGIPPALCIGEYHQDHL